MGPVPHPSLWNRNLSWLKPESIPGRTAVTPANAYIFQWQWVRIFFPWKLRATNTDWKFVSASRYAFPSCNHVQRCYRMKVFKSFGWLNISGRYAKDTTNSSFQSALLCHYHGVSETARFLCTAQTRVSTRTRDSHLISVWKRTLCWSPTSLQKKLRTDGDSRLGLW